MSDKATQLDDTIFIAKINAWEKKSMYAQGELIRCLGVAGDIHTETEAIVIENDVDTEDFPASVLESLPKVTAEGDWPIPVETIDARRDLRAEQIFTIDPVSTAAASVLAPWLLLAAMLGTLVSSARFLDAMSCQGRSPMPAPTGHCA